MVPSHFATADGGSEAKELVVENLSESEVGFFNYEDMEEDASFTSNFAPTLDTTSASVQLKGVSAVVANVTTHAHHSTEALTLDILAASVPTRTEAMPRGTSAAFVLSSAEALTHDTSTASVPFSAEALPQTQGQTLNSDVISSQAARKSKRGCKGGKRHRASPLISSVQQD